MAAFSQLCNCILRHIRARWQKALHLEQGAALSNAAQIKLHHAANISTQVPAADSPFHVSHPDPLTALAVIKPGLPLPFNPYLYISQFSVGSG